MQRTLNCNQCSSGIKQKDQKLWSIDRTEFTCVFILLFAFLHFNNHVVHYVTMSPETRDRDHVHDNSNLIQYKKQYKKVVVPGKDNNNLA
jgi:hypothetical protein